MPGVPLTEEQSWSRLTPRRRFEQYSVLMQHYLAAGGSLAPERDSQSPFDFPEYYAEATLAPTRAVRGAAARHRAVSPRRRRK